MYGYILVPTAADAHAQLAVEFAAMYAEDVGARVTLLHILPPPQQPKRRFLGKRYIPLDSETLKMMADTLLWELRPARAKSALQIDAKVIESDNVAEAIVGEVHNGDYDLLVLSTDTRTGRSALFLNQQAEQLLNQVPCTAIVMMPKSLRLDTLH